MTGFTASVRNERGSVLVLACIGLTAVLGMVALAIDIAVLSSARGQAQHAADAAALAGASAFVDESPGSAVQDARGRAAGIAQANTIQHRPVTAAEVDVAVEPGQGRVRVTVARPAVPTHFAKALGVRSVRVGASASARASEVPHASCVKPFTLPDPGGGQFRTGDALILKGMTASGEALPWDLGSLTWEGPCDASMATHTGPAYKSNICNCNLATIDIARRYSLISGASGNLRPHTEEGVRQLILQDPGAVWSVPRREVTGSAYANWRKSPRVVLVPLHDPGDVTHTVRFTRFIRVFVEGSESGTVYGRYVGAYRVLQLVQ